MAVDGGSAQGPGGANGSEAGGWLGWLGWPPPSNATNASVVNASLQPPNTSGGGLSETDNVAGAGAEQREEEGEWMDWRAVSGAVVEDSEVEGGAGGRAGEPERPRQMRYMSEAGARRVRRVVAEGRRAAGGRVRREMLEQQEAREAAMEREERERRERVRGAVEAAVGEMVGLVEAAVARASDRLEVSQVRSGCFLDSEGFDIGDVAQEIIASIEQNRSPRSD